MIKRLVCLAAAAALLAAALIPAPVCAQSGLVVVNSTSVASFPYYLDFNLEARSDADITDIRLHYRVDQDSFAIVTSEAILDFTRYGSRCLVDNGYNETGGLPPGNNRILVDAHRCRRQYT
jgi:hypothetical protein